MTNDYGLSLDDPWNVIPLENHKGRHTNVYHEYVLGALHSIDQIAKGNQAEFLYGFSILVDIIQSNSWLPYAR